MENGEWNDVWLEFTRRPDEVGERLRGATLSQQPSHEARFLGRIGW